MEDDFINEMEISLGDISIEDLDDNTPNYAQFETALNAELQRKSFDESNEGDVLPSILEQTELESIPIPKTKDELNRDPDLPAKYSSQELDYSYRIKDRFFKKDGKGIWGRYECAAKRNSHKCPATLQIHIDFPNPGYRDKYLIFGEAAHTDPPMIQKNNILKSDLNFVDVHAEMQELTDKKALESLGRQPQQIAEEVLSEMKSKYPGKQFSKFLTDNQIKRRVHYIRRASHPDWEAEIKGPLAFISPDDPTPFLQFFHTILIKNTYHTIIGWGHPALIKWAKSGPLNLFVDCTFRVVPVMFFQLLIIMVYIPLYDLYVPMFYVLLQSKDYEVYWYAIHSCIVASGWVLRSKTWTCDFEAGLLKAMKEQFPEGYAVGCLFHWKQSLRRKLMELNVSLEKISELMCEDGLINLLTVVPLSEIVNKAIPFIRANFDEGKFSKQFDKFWAYFTRYWMSDFMGILWNITNIPADKFEDVVINRTNNPIERYNRRLNMKFPGVAHPSMVHFVEVLRDEALFYVELIRNLDAGLAVPQDHQPPSVFKNPESYFSFVPPPAAQNISKGRKRK